MNTNEKPDFKSEIDDVVKFYEKFDSKFSEIDKEFDVIDENGGYQWQSIKSIIAHLKDYHAQCYGKLSKESSPKFSKPLKQLRGKFELEDLHNIIEKVQTDFHDILTHDIIWAGQRQCIEIISLALDFLSTLGNPSEKTERDTLYSTVFMLRELVADCALAINGLIPLSTWSYGTELYALLSAEQQLIILLNQAIITDRMYLSVKSLEVVLSRVNKLLDSFYDLNWLIYYDVGFLNFKIHQYSQSRRYFEVVKQQTSLKNGAEADKKKYFHAELLIAYSYEYSGDFANAITTLATSPSYLTEYLLSQDETSVGFDTIMSGLLSSIRDQDSLLVTYFELKSALNPSNPDSSTFVTIDSLLKDKASSQYAMQIEILHALAHCLNEYAVEHKNEDSKTSSKITRFARSLMHFVANENPEYWTCFATIHGEHRDYHKALFELETAKEKILTKYKNGGKRTLLAEISFFRYYFNQMIGLSAESDKNDFEEYCKKFSDEDAECHIRIFEFRNEIRKYFEQLFLDLSTQFLDNSEGKQLDSKSIRGPGSDLQNAYRKLCCLQPTLYMNANVRAELRLMQRAYICLCRLREYALNLGTKKEKNVGFIELLNASRRFLSVRTELESFFDNAPTYDAENFDIKTAFFKSTRSLSHCLHNSDSIFILAPISGVVVYQYQTGTINQLFNSNNINPESPSFERESWDSFVREFLADRQNHPGQPVIAELNWSDNPTAINEIYYWDGAFPSRLIIANKNGTIVRQIVDVADFKDKILALSINAAKSENYCCVGKHQGACTVRAEKIRWLEIINETEKEVSCLIFWKGKDLGDNVRCFIALGEAKTRHDYHNWVEKADITTTVQSGGIKTTDNHSLLSKRELIIKATYIYKKKHDELSDKKAAEKTAMQNFEDHTNELYLSHEKEHDNYVLLLSQLEVYWRERESKLSLYSAEEILSIIQTIEDEKFKL